jgi:nucleoside phosphorylase/CheY-like chemotaxis protein
MIKVLVVEDNSQKADQIKALIQGQKDLSSEITVAGTILEAKVNLKENIFDLVILDMQIPRRKNAEPSRDGGLELIANLSEEAYLNLPLYIIGLTAYEDSYKEAMGKFEEELWGLIKYSENSSSWENQIVKKLHYIADLKKNTYFSKRRTYDYDLAIVTAVPIESKAVRKLTDQWDELRIPGDPTIYATARINLKNKVLKVVTTQTNQMGMTAASLATINLVHNFSPRFVVMPGIAAGVSDETNFGDVIIADPCWDYAAGKRISKDDGKKVLLPDIRQVRIDPEIANFFQHLAEDNRQFEKIHTSWNKTKPKSIPLVHVGPVGTGSAVIADADVINEIRKLQARKLKGIDMETYGVYYACENCKEPRPKVVSMKSVCDFADKEKDDDYQEYSAYVSVEILKIFIDRVIAG